MRFNGVVPYTPVTASDFASRGLGDWRWADDAIQADFEAASFSAAGALVAALAIAADAADHHPDIELRYPGVVHVVLSTHVTGGVTEADLSLAARLSELAAASRGERGG